MLVHLPDDEAKHLQRVLRLRPGAEVFVFDGAGHEWRAEVSSASRQGVIVRLLAPIISAREPQVRIRLAIAALKGDKMDDVVRDAVMMGVTGIQPIVTTRTEISEAVLRRGNRRDRWQRIAVSSAKQCGRTVVPQVLEPVSFRDWLTATPMREVLMLVEPVAALDVQRLRDVAPRPETTLIIGPEGGWTEDELSAARAGGATLLTLGGSTLRADAMAIVALTAVRTAWGDL